MPGTNNILQLSVQIEEQISKDRKQGIEPAGGRRGAVQPPCRRRLRAVPLEGAGKCCPHVLGQLATVVQGPGKLGSHMFLIRGQEYPECCHLDLRAVAESLVVSGTHRSIPGAVHDYGPFLLARQAAAPSQLCHELTEFTLSSRVSCLPRVISHWRLFFPHQLWCLCRSPGCSLRSSSRVVQHVPAGHIKNDGIPSVVIVRPLPLSQRLYSILSKPPGIDVHLRD